MLKKILRYFLPTFALMAMLLTLGANSVTFAEDSAKGEARVEHQGEDAPQEVQEARQRLSELVEAGALQEAYQFAQEFAQKYPIQKPYTYWENIESCGFYPQEARLGCVIKQKLRYGYGGSILNGSMEHVKFCVDWDGNGSWQSYDSVGESHVHVHDDSDPSWNYLVYRDINPWMRGTGARTLDGVTNSHPTYKAKAILSWFSPPTDCNDVPYYGDIFEFRIQLDPMR